MWLTCSRQSVGASSVLGHAGTYATTAAPAHHQRQQQHICCVLSLCYHTVHCAVRHLYHTFWFCISEKVVKQVEKSPYCIARAGMKVAVTWARKRPTLSPAIRFVSNLWASAPITTVTFHSWLSAASPTPLTASTRTLSRHAAN